MQGDARSESPATPGDQAETSSYVYDLIAGVSRLEGKLEYLASLNDTTKAKIWMVVGTSVCIVSIIAALAAIISAFLRIMSAS